MKKIILRTLAVVFLILLMLGFCFFSLIKESESKSKEEEDYYEEQWKDFMPFEPLDTALILSFIPEYYEIHESKLNYEPYSSEKYLTPYNDSIISIIRENNYQWNEVKIDKIGKVDKTNILKHEKKDSIEAFIYTSSEYEDLFWGESGIWIAYSENEGKKWEYFYTGIVQGQPVFVKYYSQRPLIKEKGILEIDACLLRQLSAAVHPGPGPTYECVKDGIYLVFVIKTIAQDTDGDGLTDIIENKFFTDKYNKDTNGNGIPDNLDMNPRVSYPRTNKSKVYETILNGGIGAKDIDWAIGKLCFRGNNTITHFTDLIEKVDYEPTGKKNLLGIRKREKVSYMTPTETVLIVTDDKDLMGIFPKNYRVIFMTTEEYKANQNTYNSTLEKIYLSPLFRVDGKRNKYLVSCSIGTGSDYYLVQKIFFGWRIRLLQMMIS